MTRWLQSRSTRLIVNANGGSIRSFRQALNYLMNLTHKAQPQTPGRDPE